VRIESLYGRWLLFFWLLSYRSLVRQKRLLLIAWHSLPMALFFLSSPTSNVFSIFSHPAKSINVILEERHGLVFSPSYCIKSTVKRACDRELQWFKIVDEKCLLRSPWLSRLHTYWIKKHAHFFHWNYFLFSQTFDIEFFCFRIFLHNQTFPKHVLRT
jgi:hypothetical protein